MRLNLLLTTTLAIFFAGCVASSTPREIYYWDGSYTQAIYEYISDESDAHAQIAKLENLAQKSYERNQKVPPGLFAHLGLLYSNQGNLTKAKAYFDKEIQNFPESRAYIKFLLERQTGKKAKK